MSKSDKFESLNFEQAAEKLEGIVRKLESGDVSLDESIKLYTDGMQLAKQCNSKITQAEKKIMLLVKDSQGDSHEVDFERTLND